MDILNRPVYTDRIRPFIGKGIIKVLTGQRRVGKSYLLLQLMRDIKKEHPKANIIYVNRELESFHFIKDDKDLFAWLGEKIIKGRHNYLFVDEVQDTVSQQLLIHPERRQIGINFKFGADVLLSQPVVQQRQDLGKYLNVGDEDPAQLEGATVIHEIEYHVVGPPHLFLDLVGQFGQLGTFVATGRQHFRLEVVNGQADVIERVTDLMGDTRGQLADTGKMLCLVEPLFQSLTLAQLLYHVIKTFSKFSDFVMAFHRNGY